MFVAKFVGSASPLVTAVLWPPARWSAAGCQGGRSGEGKKEASSVPIVF